MHSIKQIKSWPGIVSQALWATPKEEDVLLKKMAIYAYDILAAAAVLATVIVGVAIYILGGLFSLSNAFLIQPLRILSLWYSLQGAVPKTFQQPLPGCEMPSDHYFVNAAEFPAVLLRQTPSDSLPPPPKIAFSWPSKNNQGANSLFLDFLNEKTTIPETSYSVWDLFSSAGSKEGASYWNKNAHILIPLLFPSKNPCPTLNPNAPVLTANAFSALHEEAVPDLRGKYIFALLMCLRFWGISLDKNLNFQISQQFDTQSIRNNPHRALLFQQIITSLVECGFAPPAVHLADFINKNKHLYNLSGDIFQELFQTLRERETHILDAAIKDSPENEYFEPTDYMSTVYWKTYMGTCASTGPYNEDGFICAATSLNATQTQEEVAQGETLQRWDLDILHLLSSSDPSAGNRPILGLQAPPYFCSLAEEKERAIPDQTSKRTFTSYITACSEWFFTKVATFGRNSAPFPINMDTPDESSVLRKMPLTPKITSKTLPFVFSRASGPLGIEVKKTTEWPPFKESRTNDFGEKFFEGTVTIPKSDTNFWNFVRQGGTELGFSYLESTHNLVQMAAPTPSTSKYQPLAPRLSRELVYRIQTDPAMASKYLLSIFTYLRFFGIELDANRTWQGTADFTARAAGVKAYTHNQLRMSRILHSLTACGFSEFAEELYQFIKLHHKEFGFSHKNHHHRTIRGRLMRIRSSMNHLAYMLPTTGWLSPMRGSYLDTFPSSGTITQFNTPPRWMSKAKVFQGMDALITKDSETGRWELPHLKAPPFFCTREEQENFEASSPATKTSTK